MPLPHPITCDCCGMNRRQFLHFGGLLAGSAGLALLGRGEPLQAATTALAGGQDQQVKIGYLPILDASPLLIADARGVFKAQGLSTTKPTRFRSWAQLSEAFLSRQVNVVHMLFPTTIWMRYSKAFPAKVVAWNHTNGSALTVQDAIDKPQDLGGKVVAIPFWYSIHNVVLQQLLRRNGLRVVRRPIEASLAPNEVNLVVLPPAEMVPALASKKIAGYIVAEPFNAAAESKKIGKVLRFTGDIWNDHACCVVLMHEDDVNKRPEWTQRVVNAIVASQRWMRSNRLEVAELLSEEGGRNYTPHSKAVLTRALTAYGSPYLKDRAILHPEWRNQRIDFQPYPFASYTKELVRLLKITQVEGDRAFLNSLSPDRVARDLVTERFVRKAIALNGGAAAFNLPANFSRQEQIVFT
ncbi:MAG: ABC transporter substrate-binding protein [Cyanobacteriota bacterium]|nr:ABC transporter substrate-binding protein [Cyanobacteriota bacterium]